MLPSLVLIRKENFERIFCSGLVLSIGITPLMGIFVVVFILKG